MHFVTNAERPAQAREGLVLGCLVALVICLTIAGAPAQVPNGRLGVKPRTEWFSLSAEEALRGQSVEFSGTILCSDPGWGQLYIHDGVNTVYLSPHAFTNRFAVGERVRISGTTTWDGAVTILTNTAAVVLGRQPLPSAMPLKLADLARGHGQWIEIEGEVRVAEASRGRIALTLWGGDQQCLVYVLQTSGNDNYKQYADCRVKLQGINASRSSDGHLQAAMVFCPGLDHVKIVKRVSSDRWKLPVTPIEGLLTKALGDWTNRPVHLNGLVSAYQPGATLVIRDPTGVLMAQVIQVSPVQLAQRVDLWGFLSVRTNRAVLGNAYFEVATPPSRETVSAAKPKPVSPGETLLTSIKAVRLLTKERANENLPARVHGVLTYVDAEWRVVFLQNKQDAIFLDTAQPELRPGDWVEVTGQTDGTGFAPQLVQCKVRSLAATNWPVPVRADVQDAAGGQLDSRWVEMEGVVRRISKQDGRISMDLAGAGGRFSAVVMDRNTNKEPAELVDSLVRLQGACGSSVNSRGQLSGVTLHTPSRNEVRVLDPSPADPFVTKAIPISEVSTYRPEQMATRRVRVNGIATVVAPGQDLYIQDASGGIRIEGSPTNDFHPGDYLEVIGFPALGSFSPSLEETVIRRVGTKRLPPAKSTTATQILQDGTYDGLMVKLNARVLQSHPQSAQPKLLLQDGPIIFTAEILQPGTRFPAPDLSAGSLVSVCGVCSVQGTGNNEPSNFRIWLSGWEDLGLISAGPWWTTRHTFMVLGGSSLVAFLASGWVLSLRRQVRLQTAILRQKQQELLATSRRAGMAEVATSVLHNVGNVLNSVNVSATVASGEIKGSALPGLALAVELLEQNRDDLGAFVTTDPRGKGLVDYLRQLAAQLQKENDTVRQELGSLCKNVDHIKDIVAMQQGLAKVGGVFQEFTPQEVIEDALLVHADSLGRHGIKIQRYYSPNAGRITADRHRLLQILINLLGNAKDACLESQNATKEITLRLDQREGRVRISVQDNGVGIAPENLTRIFNYGFTTRKGGHGFGLHSGALSAREMGGHLSAESAGTGQGACFTLELPTTNRLGRVS